MAHYDFIIAGGGAAGLSLAYQIIHSPLRDHSILIIDKSTKNQNDRTWGFWSAQPTPFDEIVYRAWGQLQIVGEDFAKSIDLQDYRYKLIRGIDFYQFVRQKLSAAGNVVFLEGVVNRIDDGADAARVTVDGQTFSGTWVFDSIFRPSELGHHLDTHQYLQLHFKGWEIETAQPAFNPRAATFMDFRTPQEQETRFFYVLPFTEQRALVEFTAFSANHFSHGEYEQALKAYLETTLGIRDYRILEEESGVIPATDYSFVRQTGRRVMTIGTKAGQVKPTTGYAFVRIQQDSASIVQSLLQHGHPFAVPTDRRGYHMLDSIMLQVMRDHGDRLKSIFTVMFKRNPIRRIFRFLDESASPWELLALIASLPPWLFLRVVFQSRVAANLRLSLTPIREHWASGRLAS